MDLATLLGLLIGLGGLIGGFLLEGGTIGMLWQVTAFVIVLGGTIGATMISFSMDEFRKLPYFFRSLFVQEKVDYVSVLETLVETADKARREGLLSLESQLSTIEDKFLARGLQLVIDGTDPELTRNMLEMEIEAYEADEEVGSNIFMAAGGFSPTMGIIGTVMGLVHVLSNIQEPDKLGGAIAVAFIATLYGVAFANVLWIPFGSKIRLNTEKDVLLMEMILEGILSIQAGENPRVIREKLMTFLPPDTREELVLEERAQLGM